MDGWPCWRAYDIEHRIVVGDRVKWVREKAYLEFDDESMVLGGFGITQDITDRKNAEKVQKQLGPTTSTCPETRHTWDGGITIH